MMSEGEDGVDGNLNCLPMEATEMKKFDKTEKFLSVALYNTTKGENILPFKCHTNYN